MISDCVSALDKHNHISSHLPNNLICLPLEELEHSCPSQTILPLQHSVAREDVGVVHGKPERKILFSV